MTSPRDTALEMLARADAADRAVRGRAAWDYRAYFAWGIWLLVFIPPLDFINGAFWGILVAATSGVGTLLTVLYFSMRTRQVHLGRAMRMRRWLVFWILWAPWYGAWIALAPVLDRQIGLGFTLAGIAGAIPCLAAGGVSWRAR